MSLSSVEESLAPALPITWRRAVGGTLLVIERESAQGKGSSGKSMGGVRAQFSTPVGIQMSLCSLPFYAKFVANLGCPCDCRPQGYLFCTPADKQIAYSRTNYTLQVKTGLKDVRLLAADELQMIDASWLSPSRFAAGRLIHETAVL
jgi:sarcosine oxidase, subunit beta